MHEVAKDQISARRSMILWGVAFMVGTFGVAGLSIVADLGSALTTILFVAAMLLLIPFVRAAERNQRINGCASTATTRYNRRMLVASMLYVVTLMGAIWLSQAVKFPAPLFVAIAIAPSLPVIGMIWAMARLLVEEDDEYLRSRHVHHSLVATGIVLTLGTVWGFLEQFNVVVHIPAYWVFPAWAMGLGISQAWSAARR